MSDDAELSAHTLTAASLAAMLCADGAPTAPHSEATIGHVSSISYAIQPPFPDGSPSLHRPVLFQWRLDKALYAAPSQLPLVGDELRLRHIGLGAIHSATLTASAAFTSTYWFHRQAGPHQRVMAILRVRPCGQEGRVRGHTRLQAVAHGGCFTYLAEPHGGGVEPVLPPPQWLRVWQVKLISWMMDRFASCGRTQSRLLSVEELTRSFALLRLCADADDASESESESEGEHSYPAQHTTRLGEAHATSSRAYSSRARHPYSRRGGEQHHHTPPVTPSRSSSRRCRGGAGGVHTAHCAVTTGRWCTRVPHTH